MAQNTWQKRIGPINHWNEKYGIHLGRHFRGKCPTIVDVVDEAFQKKHGHSFTRNTEDNDKTVDNILMDGAVLKTPSSIKNSKHFSFDNEMTENEETCRSVVKCQRHASQKLEDTYSDTSSIISLNSLPGERAITRAIAANMTKNIKDMNEKLSSGKKMFEVNKSFVTNGFSDRHLVDRESDEMEWTMEDRSQKDEVRKRKEVKYEYDSEDEGFGWVNFLCF